MTVPYSASIESWGGSSDHIHPQVYHWCHSPNLLSNAHPQSHDRSVQLGALSPDQFHVYGVSSTPATFHTLHLDLKSQLEALTRAIVLDLAGPGFRNLRFHGPLFFLILTGSELSEPISFPAAVSILPRSLDHATKQCHWPWAWCSYMSITLTWL